MLRGTLGALAKIEIAEYRVALMAHVIPPFTEGLEGIQALIEASNLKEPD